MQLPKRPNFLDYEPRLYQMWERAGYFTPKINPKKRPFTILLPPPNANAPLHVGHAMYVVEDILARFHRMLGQPTLFLPGTDHAGIETQFVFEQHLAKQGLSRFDFDRKTLYQKIYQFVEKNRGIAAGQLKKLGFSLDWTREKYTLDPKILRVVFDTFRKLHGDGLIYRDERLVNYCTHCGTGFSNLEVNYQERTDPLYYLKYGPFTLATTRPETKFGDTAVAVHPEDKRYQKWIGKEFTYESLVGPRKMRVVADRTVDPGFGTGVVKVTPAHDAADFAIAQRHNLDVLKVINRHGQLTKTAGRFAGLTVKEGRERVVRELKQRGDLVKVDKKYLHRVGLCYRCKTTIEPLLFPQWYVRVEPLIKTAIKAVQREAVKLFPPRFKKELLHWLKTAPDWNISRQIVWGPRIPAWYCLTCSSGLEITFLNKNGKAVTGQAQDLIKKYNFEEIEGGLQNLIAPVNTPYLLNPDQCKQCGNTQLLQETDTFDTWFSSGQWPFTTLSFAKPDSSANCKLQTAKMSDFEYFYPTSVLDTMWDILPFWVMRMLILGLYRTGQAPFKWVHLHSRVVDAKGVKMSKSRGNVIEPIALVEKYSADALRFALVFGTAPASNIPLGEEKLVGARNFITKIWNIARFVLAQNTKTKMQNVKCKITRPTSPLAQSKAGAAMQNLKLLKLKEDKELIAKLNRLIEGVTKNLKNFQFSRAAEELHQFIWHELADKYIEDFKSRSDNFESLGTLHFALCVLLKLLHPFMPFVTEEIYQKLPNKDAKSITIAPWPKAAKTQTRTGEKTI